MINKDDKLIVLENFRIDRNLPKYVSKEKKRKGGNFEASEDEMMMDSDFSVTQVANPAFVGSRGVRLVPIEKKPSFLQRFLIFLSFWKPYPKLTPPKEISIEEFFSSIKNTTEELVIVEERARGYGQAMLNAKQAGQQALLEQLQAGLNATKMETQLLAIGLPKFIREENIVKFYKQSKKGLRLDWIANFTRVIPPDLLEKKIKADEIGIFDNYVILHYDPSAKSYAETKAETAARKDPILFGLMDGRRILYHVCDWVDELCDLTLDQVAEALGKEVIQEISPII
jgi:hypothetical protein